MKNSIVFKFFIVAIAAGMMYGCSCEKSYEGVDQMVAQAKTGINEIAVADFKAKYDNFEPFVLIDVRTESEHNHGYIPGAVNIPRGVLEFRIAKQDYWDNAGLYMPGKDEEIIIYCKKGQRGALAAETLRKMGYTNVKNLEGGWKNWEMNYPLEYEKNLEDAGHGGGGEVGGC